MATLSLLAVVVLSIGAALGGVFFTVVVCMGNRQEPSFCKLLLGLVIAAAVGLSIVVPAAITPVAYLVTAMLLTYAFLH